MKEYTVIYKIADPNSRILIRLEAENKNEAQDIADDSFQLEHSPELLNFMCIDDIVEGHDDVMAQVGERLNYGFGYNDTNSIAIVWCIDDVRYQLRDHFNVPMDSLTDEECMEVLRIAESNHDAEMGLSYETINCAIDYAFEDKIAELQNLREHSFYEKKGNTNEED